MHDRDKLRMPLSLHAREEISVTGFESPLGEILETRSSLFLSETASLSFGAPISRA
jgi:hypothetical protein